MRAYNAIRVSWPRGSYESLPVLVDKCFERRRRPTTNRFDQVVRSGEDPVLVVDGDLAQVLDDERIARPAVWCLFKLAVQRSGGVFGRGLLPPEAIIWSMVSMLTCLYWTSIPSTRLRTLAIPS